MALFSIFRPSPRQRDKPQQSLNFSTAGLHHRGATWSAVFLAVANALSQKTGLLPLVKDTMLADRFSNDRSSFPVQKKAAESFSRKIDLHGNTLELHLNHAQEERSLSNILILFASGDG